jgi:hypothetical protein
MDMNSILIIVGSIVLIGVAGGCIFAALKVRGLIRTFDTRVDPMLADMKAKTAAIKPAAEQVSGIMQQLNVTIDAAHMTVLDLDGKLEKLSGMTGKVTYVLETAPETAKGVAGAIKRALPHKR